MYVFLFVEYIITGLDNVVFQILHQGTNAGLPKNSFLTTGTVMNHWSAPTWGQGSILLTQINFNPCMDK